MGGHVLHFCAKLQMPKVPVEGSAVVPFMPAASCVASTQDPDIANLTWSKRFVPVKISSSCTNVTIIVMVNHKAIAVGEELQLLDKHTEDDDDTQWCKPKAKKQRSMKRHARTSCGLCS